MNTFDSILARVKGLLLDVRLQREKIAAIRQANYNTPADYRRARSLAEGRLNRLCADVVSILLQTMGGGE